MNMEIPQNKYNNLTREERSALCNLENVKNIVIKSAKKGSTVAVQDRNDYIKEAEENLGDKDIYEEVCNYFGPLTRAINKVIEKLRKKGDLIADTIKYFIVKDPKFARFNLLPKIQSGCMMFQVDLLFQTAVVTENLDFHLLPLAREVKSYIIDTNDFSKKFHSLPDLPDDIFCLL